MNPEFKFPLGVTAKDKISGVEGIITSRTQHLNGCNRYGIERSLDKDGKLPDVLGFDEARIELVAGGPDHSAMVAEAAKGPPGGPRAVIPRD